MIEVGIVIGFGRDISHDLGWDLYSVSSDRIYPFCFASILV